MQPLSLCVFLVMGMGGLPGLTHVHSVCPDPTLRAGHTQSIHGCSQYLLHEEHLCPLPRGQCLAHCCPHLELGSITAPSVSDALCSSFYLNMKLSIGLKIFFWRQNCHLRQESHDNVYIILTEDFNDIHRMSMFINEPQNVTPIAV